MILLATYWFFLIGALGLFFPYYSLYLSENAGLTGSEVGLVMATLPLVGILFQPLWGQVADRTGSRETVLTLVSAGAAAGYAGLYFAGSFVSLLAGTALLAVFSTATIPMCVSVCFDLLPDRGPHAFGLTRTWGTVGFLVAVVVFPYALDRWQAWRGLDAVAGGPSEPGLEIMLPATACLLLCAMVVSLFIPRKRSHAVRAGRGDWRELLGHGPFVRVLVFIFASYVCLQGPIVLFPIFVRSLGGSVAMVSHMWIFMLLLEIPLIALSGAGFTRLGGRGLLAIGIAAGAVRWLVAAVATNLHVVYAVQVLHGVTVAGLIIGGPLYVDAVVPAKLRSTAQGALSMMGMGVGGIVSNVGSGVLIDAVGAKAPALIGGAGAALLTVVMWWLVPRAPAAKSPAPEPRASAEIV